MKSFFQSFFIFLLPNFLAAQPAVFTPRGLGGGGATYAPSISPFDDQKIFMMCDMAGAYHSENQGDSWTMFDMEQFISSTQSQIQFTSDPQVLYGIRKIPRGAFSPRDLAKSTDGGTTWFAVNNPCAPLTLFYLFSDPTAAGTLVAADRSGVYFSKNSTASWTKIYTDPQNELHLAGAFFDGQNIYVGTSDGMLVSTNGGTSFSISTIAGLPAGSSIFCLNGAKQGATVRLFCSTVKSSVIYSGMETRGFGLDDITGFFKLNVGAGNWTSANGNLPAGTKPTWAVLPNGNINLVYAQAYDTDNNNMVFKSTDGGATWASIFKSGGNENIATAWRGQGSWYTWLWGSSNCGLEVAPNNPNVVIATDYSGPWISSDGGATWRAAYVQPAYRNAPGAIADYDKFYKSNGFNTTTSNDVLFLSEKEIFLSNADIKNWHTTDGGETWSLHRSLINIGNWWEEESNWFKMAKNPATGRLFGAVSQINDLYTGGSRVSDFIDSQVGRLVTSTDNGQTWQVSFDNQNPIAWVEIDPQNPNTMYLASVNSDATGGIFKSTNGGSTWAKLPAPPRTEGHPFNIRVLKNGELVVSYGARDALENGNYSASSGVFYSTDGGQTWADRSHADMQFFTRDVLIDPNDATENTWFAAVWDFSNSDTRGGLYRTTNRGANWTKVYDYSWVQSVGFSPTHPGRMYLALEYGGLLVTENSATNTPVFERVTSFPYARPHGIFFNPFKTSELWVTTYGGAVWSGEEEPAAPVSNFPTSFEPKGFGGGGYMYAPSISPSDPNRVFINCDMGGIYRSLDGAQTFKMMHTEQLVSTVKGKIQFTSDPNILFTVRRSTSNLEDPLWRGELAKSTDGGVTWQAFPDPTGSGVHRLEVDPGSTQRLILNEYNQLFFSGNGGTTWTSVFQPADQKIWLGGVFWDGQNIYVGTDKGLLVSKNGGASFAIENHSGLPAATGIYHLAGAKAGGTVRLFCLPVTDSELVAWNDPLGVEDYLKGIFRMNYTANAAWTNTRGNIPADVDIAWVDLAKNNTQIVWAEGADANAFTMTFKSTNGGTSWTNVYQTAGNQNIATGWAGADGAFWLQQSGAALGFDVSDTDPNHVVRTHGFAETTTDGGATWRSIYNLQNYLNPAGQPTEINKFYKSSGLDVTTAHHVFWKNENEVFLANTDVGMTYSANAGDTWTWKSNTFWDYGPVANNNWYRIVERPDNHHIFAAVCNVNDIYSPRVFDWEIEWSGGLVVRSTDGGATFDTLFNFGHPVVWLEIDKNNPARMWASVVHSTEGGIFRSQNGGQTWTKLPAPPRTEGHPYNIVSLADGGLVVTFSARGLADGETLGESSGVFFSSDNGNSWQDRTAPAMKFFTKDLVVDPHDASGNTWFATVWGRHTVWPAPNNQTNGGLYKTTNRGLTWTRIFSNTPADQTESLTIHPTKPGTAYLTVENVGLFFTENLGAAQPVFEKVTSYPWWRPKRVFFNPFNDCEVWVTSMGGGLWKGETTGADCCPLVAATITGGADVCADGTVAYSTAAQAGATYLWTVTGGAIVSGQGTNAISVLWGAGGAGAVKVVVSQ